MPRLGLAADGPRPLDLPAIFGREAPVIVDIGFGMGDATAQIAERQPQFDFIGIEVHTPGIGALMRRIEASGLTNIRVIEGDADVIFDRLFRPDSIAGIHLFFPDPWPKKRHHKRRLVNAQFLTKVFPLLTTPGYVHWVTDWADYADSILVAFEHSPFGAVVPTDSLAPSVENAYGSMIRSRPVTKFERRGQALGHPVVERVGQSKGAP
ncbi:MAG: tRNA (guanosine(46)-N7)-methyltransferase TrmB [Burkholderiaceae bacterium]